MAQPAKALTYKQSAAVEFLLTNDGTGDVAAKVGVSRRSLCRWLLLPEFIDALAVARGRAFDRAIGRLASIAGQAVETLQAVMSDTEAAPSARVSAARTVLELSAASVSQTDLSERVAALEKVNETTGH